MKLWNGNIPHYNDEYNFEPYITPYIVDGAKTVVVVCPGGAYARRAEHEGRVYAVAYFYRSGCTSGKFDVVCDGIGRAFDTI